MCKLWRGISAELLITKPQHRGRRQATIWAGSWLLCGDRQLDIGHHRNIMFIQMICTIKQSSKTSSEHHPALCLDWLTERWLAGRGQGGFMLYIHTGHKNESVCIFYTFPTCNCYRFLVLTIYTIHLEMLHNEYHGTCVRGGEGSSGDNTSIPVQQ